MNLKKCIMIYNSNSGKKHISEHLFYPIFEKYDYEIEIIHTEYQGHAQKIVREIKEVDLVISAGGDGTYNEVVTGNLERKKPLLLGNLPIGTVNDVGHMYGYTNNTLKNLELLLSGTIKTIDVSNINHKIFTYVACFGNFMNIAYETPRILKKKYGRVGYLIYGLQAVKDKLKLYDVDYELENIHCSGRYSLIFIVNSDRVAGIKDLFEDIKLDDGKFEVVLCNLTSKKDLIKNLLLLPLRHINQIPGFSLYKTNNFKMTVKDRQETSWCIDGEKLNDSCDTFTIKMDQTMSVLIPNKNIDQLFLK